MRTISVLALLVALFSSCGGSGEEVVIPNEIIGKDTMKILVREISIISASSDLQLMRGANKKEQINSYYKSLFDEYDVTESRYAESFNYYSSHPELFLEIYDGAMEDLSIMEGELGLPTP